MAAERAVTRKVAAEFDQNMLRLCLLAQILNVIHSFQFQPTTPLCVNGRFISAAAAPARRISFARSLRKSEAYTTRMALTADSQTANLDAHIPIDLEYPGLRKV